MISKETKHTVLNGLVLAGGKSKRMGHDKSIINWHGKEQRYYIADLLQQLCHEVYISCRPEQVSEIDSGYKTLPDTYEGMGPYGGIMTALDSNLSVGWLVVACDLPLLDMETLEYLILNRDESKIATTFKSPHDGLPEPLITIWEPQSIEQLGLFMSKGYTCPRKVLINSDVHLLEPVHPDALINANTPGEAERVRNIIANKINT